MAELLVTTVDQQICDVTEAAPAPHRAFVGTLLLFILIANWSSLIPGVTPTTATMETPAALAAIVFLSIIYFGIRGGGVGGFLRGCALANPVMSPLNIVESVTRSFSMFVRLFGNVMSGVDKLLRFDKGAFGFAQVLEPERIGCVLLDADHALQARDAVCGTVDVLQTHADFHRCSVVVAGPASPPGLQWIAPFAGMTMAEHLRDNGQHALIVIDDLTKHAATHREIAPMTRQSPGREAYPGDVFYVYARLLESAAKLSQTKGGGSLTALPIAQTEAGNLSAHIPTNLISITDGQIVLDARLFHEGQ